MQDLQAKKTKGVNRCVVFNWSKIKDERDEHMYTHTQQYKHTIKQNHATELEPHPSKIKKINK